MHTLAPALSHTRGCGDNQLYTLTCVYALEYVKDKHVRTRVRVLLCVEGRGQTINEIACVYGERGERGPERALT